MGAGTGVGSPAQQRVPSVSRAVETLRTELDDPAMTILAIASLTLLTFTAVRITGGAPSALMELGYAPVALAAYAFGSRGGLAIGIVVGAILGPLPALLGFSGVEGPAEWLIRVTAYAGVGTVIGAMLGRTAVDASEVHARLAEIQERERQSLLALATAAESRDTDAGEHVRRLEVTSRTLAARLGMSEREIDQIGMGAAFHDIGKIRVPERILMKPDALDPDEWTVVRLHPIWSEQALGAGAHLALAREVARWHHENWDGSGYPDGLYGDRIPLAARIVRIADAFDAMTNRRPYQQPVSFEAALEEIQAGAGQEFDPTLVERFVEMIRGDADLRAELTDLRLV
jgi:HD domain-containing protein